MSLQGKTALVTGGSRGIGRAIAEALAKDGARVFVNYAKNADAANEVVQAIQNAGGEAFAVGGDVSKLDAIDALIAQVGEHGKLDILVNNAGYGDFTPFLEATPEHFDGQFDLNVRGLFFVTQRALKIMNDGGRIINISSIASRGLNTGAEAYSMTKAAVNAFTSALSKGVGERGITVNAVSPGLVDTDLTRQAMSQDEFDRIAKGSQFGRVGHVDDISGVVAFLASDAARWITGREIVVDGGTI